MPAYGSLRGSSKTAIHYDPSQSRDEDGRWSSTGAGGRVVARRQLGSSVGKAQRKARDIVGMAGGGMADPRNKVARINMARDIKAFRGGLTEMVHMPWGSMLMPKKMGGNTQRVQTSIHASLRRGAARDERFHRQRDHE